MADRSSTTKSGHRHRNFSLSLRLSPLRRDHLTQEVSGARMAPLVSRNPADESKTVPVPSTLTHCRSWKLISEPRSADPGPAGDMISRSPSDVRSILSSLLSSQSAWSWSSERQTAGFSRSLTGSTLTRVAGGAMVTMVCQCSPGIETPQVSHGGYRAASEPTELPSGGSRRITSRPLTPQLKRGARTLYTC